METIKSQRQCNWYWLIKQIITMHSTLQICQIFSITLNKSSTYLPELTRKSFRTRKFSLCINEMTSNAESKLRLNHLPHVWLFKFGGLTKPQKSIQILPLSSDPVIKWSTYNKTSTLQWWSFSGYQHVQLNH